MKVAPKVNGGVRRAALYYLYPASAGQGFQGLELSRIQVDCHNAAAVSHYFRQVGRLTARTRAQVEDIAALGRIGQHRYQLGSLVLDMQGPLLKQRDFPDPDLPRDRIDAVRGKPGGMGLYPLR